ncbi:hypothetical protein HPB48_010745 [Haemaphysalis longicornis]|uniref:Uncharacterized protein n=1 Tax=Haemaphysalis longicornis TaxID=44386 RepID=A0A9J6GLB8_HAELO|nr:hypothetical protein HPB48_010745 [Haemaphysalis longicornis]
MHWWMCEMTSLWLQSSRERPFTSRISSPTSKSARSAGEPATRGERRTRTSTAGRNLAAACFAAPTRKTPGRAAPPRVPPSHRSRAAAKRPTRDPPAAAASIVSAREPAARAESGS